ncbi:hypothetical protein Cgig2_013698 [Carnegiea gigantea]|uniref:Uncharacterized protein n=1 Tax=Carnegiea gigantea TaxID=171969 RepID=A0A9Q1QG79_9CARY|nr:hypothetical protein Cgig2_013698 [Carnegiea gigantea]
MQNQRAYAKAVDLLSKIREEATVEIKLYKARTRRPAMERQVSEEVKRAIEAANSARSFPHFDYIPTHGGEPSHRPERVPSPDYLERKGEVSRSNRSARPSGRPTQGATAKSITASTTYATYSKRTTWLEEQEQTYKPRGEISGRRRLSPERCTHRDRT